MRARAAAVGLVLLLAGPGCATVLTGSERTVLITSNAPNSTVETPEGDHVRLPAEVQLSTGDSLAVSSPGYRSRWVRPERSLNKAVACNCALGGLFPVGLVVDVLSGGAWDYEDMHVELDAGSSGAPLAAPAVPTRREPWDPDRAADDDTDLPPPPLLRLPDLPPPDPDPRGSAPAPL